MQEGKEGGNIDRSNLAQTVGQAVGLMLEATFSAVFAFSLSEVTACTGLSSLANGEVTLVVGAVLESALVAIFALAFATVEVLAFRHDSRSLGFGFTLWLDGSRAS